MERNPVEINLLHSKGRTESRSLAEIRKEKEDALVQEWRESPLIFASGSAKKAAQLDQIGFSGPRRLVPVPDQLEIDNQHLFEQTYRETHWSIMGREAPEEIAAGKVRHILAVGDAAEDELIIAADTTAMYIPYDSPDYRVKALTKPESIEDARAMITELLSSIAREYIIRNFSYLAVNRKDRGFTTQQIENVYFTELSSYLQCHISVGTGVAFRFPHEENRIRIGGHHLKLFPFSIYKRIDEVQAGSTKLEVSDEELARIMDLIQPDIDKMVDAIIQEQGDLTLNISGAVDYSREKIRQILGIEVKERLSWDFVAKDKVKPDWFTGLSPDLVIDLLKQFASIKVYEDVEEEMKKITKT